MDPVGGVVAGGVEAGEFAEGLQQDGADAVAGQPVDRQSPGHAGEQVAGEMGHAHAGEEASVSSENYVVRNSRNYGGFGDLQCVTIRSNFRCWEPAVGLSGTGGRVVPRDEAQGHASVAGGGVGEVAQLGSGQGREAEEVVALDVLVPESAAGVASA